MKHFLPILERLCGYAETEVRKQVVKSFGGIIEIVDIDSIFTVIIPCYNRLSNEENFHSRVSACSLTSAIYAKLEYPSFF